MKHTPRELSVAEWEIMHAVWQAGGPATVRRVLDITYPNGEKAYTTVQTLMNIMVEKGFLAREKRERTNHYTPLTSREDILHGSLRGVAQRMFQGSFGAMASFMVGSGKFSPEELVELKRVLKEKSGEIS